MNAKLSLNHPQAHPVSRASRAWALSLLITVTCLLASPARAILVTWTNAATGVWTNPVVWNPNGAPVATNDYLVSGAFTMQSVDTNTSIFNANSVTVQSGSTLYFYRSNGGTSLSTTNIFTNTVAATASTLTVSNAIIKLDSSLGSVLHHLKTPLLLKGTNTITYGTTDGYTLDLYLDSPLTGSGSVNLTRSTSGTSHQRDFYLTGDSSGYSGSWTNTGTAAGTTSGTLNFYSTAVSGWGSGNMTLNAYANLTISAAITNPAPRITLNSSSATLTVNSASVIGSLSGVASSTATLNSGLTLADNTSTTFAGSLSGAGALTKNGTGTLILPNANLNTATNTINAGTLIAAGSVGALTMNKGATLAPGAAALTAGSLSVNGNLTFNTNILNLDVSSSTSSGNDSIYVGGNLVLSGVTTVNLNLLSGSAAAGPYTVINYSGTLTGGVTNFAIVGSHSATLDFSTPNQINLWFTNGAPRNLVWRGDGGSNYWDAGTSFTWFNGTATDYFGQGDNTTLDDTATNLTVNVIGTVSPGLFVVTNSTNNFVIQGAGAISGGAALLKAGTASLIVSNLNAFTGGTTISAGSIIAKNATNSLGTGPVTLGDANTGTNTVALYVTYKDTFTNAISVTGAGTGTVTIGSDQSGGASGNSTTISGPISLNQSLIIDSGNQLDRLHIGGAITGTGNLTLLGGHRIDLGGNNTFSGNVYLQGAGTLFESFSASAIPSTASVDVGPGSTFGNYIDQHIDALTGTGLVEPYAASGTLYIGMNGGSGTFSGILTNSGTYGLTLVKNGSGTETINGADYLTATTVITNGTLAIGAAGTISNSALIAVASGATFDVSAQGGTFTLAPGQTIAGAGSVSGSFITAGNATISPGGTGSPNTLTFNNNLTLGGNSVLALDLTNTTTAGSAVNDLITVYGNLNLAGTNLISLPALSQQALVTGTYQLISYSGTLTGAATNFVITPVLTRLTLTVDTSTPNQVNLIVSGSSNPNLVWTGGLNGNVWDVATTTNWFNGTGPDVFYQEDGANFTDSGATNPVVSLATVLYPTAVTVNSSSNYTFTGSGRISGLATLTKSGTGTLTLTTSNDFAGGIAVNGGLLQIGNGSTNGVAGSGPVTNLATVLYYRNDTNGLTLANNYSGGGTYIFQSTGTLLQGAYTLTGDNSGMSGTVVANAARVAASTQLRLGSAAVLVATNGGEYYLSAVDTYTNAFKLAGGGWTETAGNLGALRLGGNGSTITGPVTLLGNAVLGAYSSGDSGTISGNIVDNASGYGFTKNGAGTLILTGSNTYSGGTLVTNGTLNVYGDQSTSSGGWSLPYNYNTATLNFESGSTILVSAGKLVQVGSSPAAGTASQTLNAYGTVTNNGTTLVSRSGFLNLNSGGLWVQNGPLSVNPPSASGYSAYLTVNAGATLIYNNTNTIKLEPSTSNTGLGSLTNYGTIYTAQGFERTNNASAANPILVLNGGVISLLTNIPALTSSTLVTTGGVLAVQMAGSGGVIDTHGFSTTISNVVSGAGSLTKMGGGTLALPFTNTFTGATVVSNGTLLVNGKLAPGSTVTVATNATLAGTGIVGGPTTIQWGGLVQPGAGTLTISNLTLGASSTDISTTAFNLGAGGKIATASLYVAGTNVVNILDSALTLGTNNLITYTTISGNGLAGFVLGTLPANTTATLQDSGTAIQLVVTAVGVPPTVTTTPASTNVYASATVVFTASATGTAPVTLQWFDNHTNAIAGATNATLTLTNLTVSQTGNYTVAATNVAGNASAVAALTVNALVAPTLSGGATLVGGNFQLTFSGPAGETFKVVTTTNVAAPVASWTVVTNGTFGAGPVTFADPATAANPQRYYRVTAP